MKAGVDLGSTLVKAVWKTDEYNYISSADYGVVGIIIKLKSEGVKDIKYSGIGLDNLKYFDDFNLSKAKGDQIENEIKFQANGTKELLKENINNYLIVSIGTGTSYTFVGDKIEKYPIGNSLGGGFIDGMRKIFGENDYEEFVTKAFFGKSLDYCIKDMIPEKYGTFEGEIVVANFAKANNKSDENDIFFSIMNTVAVSIVRDLLLINSSENIVYIGSTVSRNGFLRLLLKDYTTAIGKNCYFPDNGEYALAMGAYLN
ncbi:hypothetical protein ACFL1H_04450 [Nanoarchaeota archaeon]